MARLRRELNNVRHSDHELSECGTHDDLVPWGEQYALSQIALQVGELRHEIRARKLGHDLGSFECREDSCNLVNMLVEKDLATNANHDFIQISRAFCYRFVTVVRALRVLHQTVTSLSSGSAGLSPLVFFRNYPLAFGKICGVFDFLMFRKNKSNFQIRIGRVRT